MQQIVVMILIFLSKRIIARRALPSKEIDSGKLSCSSLTDGNLEMFTLLMSNNIGSHF